MREHLKLQQELFLSFLMDRLIKPITNMSGASLRKVEMESELDASTWNLDASLISAQPGMKTARDATLGMQRRDSGSLSASSGPSGRHTNQQFHGSEGRDLMMEYLGQAARAPDFMINLWINYDCNVDCEDMYERLIKFFSRVSKDYSPPHQTLKKSTLDLGSLSFNTRWSIPSRQFATLMPRLSPYIC